MSDLPEKPAPRPAAESEGPRDGGGNAKLTVYYDGACPRCVEDRCTYERLAGRRGEEVAWFDITGQAERLKEIGIDPRRALTELHVSDEHQRVHSELDAYILLLEKVPLLRPLAWLIRLPLLKPWLGRLYRNSVLKRLSREGRLPPP